MSPVIIVLLVILAVLIIGLVVLYFLRNKAQKKKAEQDEQLAAAAQTVSMLVIDKKRMRITESGLPQVVIDQAPKMMRRRIKLPIVKAKVGPKVMSLIADESVFDYIPVKKEVKATVSGIYITKVTGVRGPLEKPEGKKSWRTKLKEKAARANKELEKEKISHTKNTASVKNHRYGIFLSFSYTGLSCHPHMIS